MCEHGRMGGGVSEDIEGTTREEGEELCVCGVLHVCVQCMRVHM